MMPNGMNLPRHPTMNQQQTNPIYETIPDSSPRYVSIEPESTDQLIQANPTNKSAFVAFGNSPKKTLLV